MCWEFGPVNSIIQTIWKNRTKIIGAFEMKRSGTLRFRKPERSDVGKVLLMWFQQDRSEKSQSAVISS